MIAPSYSLAAVAAGIYRNSDPGLKYVTCPMFRSTAPSDVYEVIVVDGHSLADTLAVVRKLRPDSRIVMQTRRGKGNAFACECAAANRRHYR